MKTRKRRRRARERARKLRAIGFKLLLVLLALLLIIGAVLLIDVFRRDSGFPEDEVRFYWEEGQLWVSWPELPEEERCRVYRYDAEKGSYVLVEELTDNELVLSDVREGEPVSLSLQAVQVKEDLFGRSKEKLSEKLELDVIPVSVKVPNVVKASDKETQQVTLQWQKDKTEYYEIYFLNQQGEWQYFAETASGETSLDFMQEENLPGRETPIQMAVRACYPQEDGVFLSALSAPVLLERSELMPPYVDVTWEKTTDNMYYLYWKESVGDLYEVQQWNYQKAVWEGLAVLNWDEPLEYRIGRISSSRNSRFRVITYDEDTAPEKRAEVAEPGIVNFWSELSPLYCTIWPIIDLEMYPDASSSEVLRRIPAGEALCVLAEENDRFQVMYDDTYGYVNSGYCLINLPEYLGDLCMYSIENSSSSVFRVHEYDMPHVTDTVLKGYEDVMLANGEVLVPYLYPCAQKLRVAAEKCQEDGYCLEIYDAFRPNETTRYLYDTATRLLDYPVTVPYAPGVLKTPAAENTLESENGEELPAEETVQPVSDPEDIYNHMMPEVLDTLLDMPPGALPTIGLTSDTVARVSQCSAESLIFLKNMSYETLSLLKSGVFDLDEQAASYLQSIQAQVDVTSLPKVRVDTSALGIPMDNKGGGVQALPIRDVAIWLSLPDDQLNAFKMYLESSVQTFHYVMTNNGAYRLGSFLAQSVSAHNRGIALDLTLRRWGAENALAMQTSMHDLSWYSAKEKNNGNADLLASYMMNAGFNDLSSEWWHFQDDETREKLNLDEYLVEGVSIEGWKKNDSGWYYQLADGTYYQSVTVEIDGTNRTFDENGYCDRD